MSVSELGPQLTLLLNAIQSNFKIAFYKYDKVRVYG